MEVKQVLFASPETNDVNMGILVNNEYVICAECGGVMEVEEVVILSVYDYWVSFEDEIADEDALDGWREKAKKFTKAGQSGEEVWKNARDEWRRRLEELTAIMEKKWEG